MPKRSTPETDEAQRRVALRFVATSQEFPGGGMLSTPPGGTFARIDYLVREPDPYNSGRVLAALEVKCRRQTSETFQNVWVEQGKVAALTHWSAIYEVPGFFVASWADGVTAYCDVDRLREVSGRPVVRRRGDRGDPLDTDVVYELPIYQMTRLP
jgi:hypothetical protein